MTTPEERTRAVIETRGFLQTLVDGHNISMFDLIRSVAVGLLRHYPHASDLAVSAEKLPDIWASPAESERRARAKP
jgi:hypothetical protein